MRKINHPVTARLLRDTYDYHLKAMKESFAGWAKEKRKRNEEWFLAIPQEGLAVAKNGYLFDAPLKEIIDVLGRSLPAVSVALELGAVLSPIDLRDYLGAALVVGEKRLLTWFAELPRRTFKTPAIEISEAGYLLIQAVQEGMKGHQKRFQSASADFEAALAPKKLIVDRRSEAAIYQPLAALLQAISRNDQSAFNHAWIEQGKAWKKRFGKTSEKANAQGLLDFEALGLGKIAQKFGLDVKDTNPYAPVALLAATATP